MTWTFFILGSLATYRLALMLSSEEGPVAIFSRMRRTVQAKTNPGRGIRCFNCWSVWLSILITAFLIYLGETQLIHSPLYVFAMSGTAMLLNRFSSTP